MVLLKPVSTKEFAHRLAVTAKVKDKNTSGVRRAVLVPGGGVGELLGHAEGELGRPAGDAQLEREHAQRNGDREHEDPVHKGTGFPTVRRPNQSRAGASSRRPSSAFSAESNSTGSGSTPRSTAR